MAKKKKKSTLKKTTSKAATKKEAVIVDSTNNEFQPPANTEAHKTVSAEIVSEPKTATKDYDSKLPALGDGLSSYMKSINKYPLLTREQESEIAKRYKEKGNPEDAEILVTANLRFVVKVAAEYTNFGAKLIDLIQEGNVGLMHGVKEFNPYKGVRLITYAVWWIRGYIHEYMMKQYSMVRIGTTHNQRKLFYKLEKEKNRLDQLGQNPTVKLLSANLGVPEKDVKMMQERLNRRDMSLDQSVSGDDSSTFLDFEANDDVSPDQQLIAHEQLEQLSSTLSDLRGNLNEKEIYILENRILSDTPLKLQNIGDEWGVTREAVRQMEARLVKKIRTKFTENLPKI